MIDKKRFDESADQRVFLLVFNVVTLFEYNCVRLIKVAMHFDNITIILPLQVNHYLELQQYRAEEFTD